MKKLIILFLLIFSRSSTLINTRWYNPKVLLEKKLNIGDIIVRRKGMMPLEWYGHVAIVVDNRSVVEFPNITAGFCKVKIENWIVDSKEVKVLRNNFKFDTEKLLDEIYSYRERRYGINFDPRKNNKFYCSQFVWYIYYNFYHLNVLPYRRYLIQPYDFLDSPYLYEI